eukprot:1157186-Pelagomonas_calceolata.AAC.10
MRNVTVPRSEGLPSHPAQSCRQKARSSWNSNGSISYLVGSRHISIGATALLCVHSWNLASVSITAPDRKQGHDPLSTSSQAKYQQPEHLSYSVMVHKNTLKSRRSRKQHMNAAFCSQPRQRLMHHPGCASTVLKCSKALDQCCLASHGHCISLALFFIDAASH